MEKPKFNFETIILKKSCFELKKSFKNIDLRKILTNVKLNDMKYNKIDEENNYEGIMGVILKGTEKEEEEVFSIEILFSVFVNIENFSEDQIFEIFNINLSSLVYPYVRSEMSRLILEAGLPKFNLPFIDFSKLYYEKYKKES